MKSKVYFAPVSANESEVGVRSKLSALIDEYNLLSCVKKGDRAVLKLHFGEEGNTGYVRPAYVGAISAKAACAGAVPFIADSNTLYRGRRTNSADHLKLAYEHGFIPEIVGGDVVIPDDTGKGAVKEIELNGSHVKTAKICRIFWDADCLIGIAHFKGHLMTGFGGALKNIGMGCASRDGKLFQHGGMAPVVVKRKCVGCGVCANVCPVSAVSVAGSKARVDPAICVGCASCIAACKFNAMDINWAAGGSVIQERMVEYAKAVLSNKRGKTVFFNFLIKITRECDCLAKDDPRIVGDIGIMASEDPVAVDAASYDMVVKKAGKDIFKEIHPDRDGRKQLEYAAKIGVGNVDHELVFLSSS